MNAWLQFLSQHQAQINESSGAPLAEFPRPATFPTNYVAPLADTGLIAASGEDASNFLHNQLTNDVEHLSETEARLAGYCSPKGRMLATFLMWKTADAIMLQLPRQIQPALQKRLQMFVLRAKVKLNDVTDNHAVLGLGGASTSQALASWFSSLPATSYAKIDSPSGTLIRLPDAFGEPRFQWIAPMEVAERAWPEMIKMLTPVSTSLWRLGDIHAGIPQVTQATQEQFVPQMINFELIGGVNFKKGCYPGQEVVARSQYLGKQKRRMLLASIDTVDARAGMEVFSSTDPDQPCGMIVNAEHNLQGGCDCLVELKTAAVEEGTVHLGSAAGSTLKLIPLPYPLPA